MNLPAHDHRIHRPQRRDQANAKRHFRHEILGRYDQILEGRQSEWKDKTQWHNIIAFGQGFAQTAPRLLKGTHVFVQGELTTREYDRTIKVPSGKKSIEHIIQQLAVELKADTIRPLDRSIASAQQSDVAESTSKRSPTGASLPFHTVTRRRYFNGRSADR